METWGAGVIFQSTPCPALLNFTCSSSCPGVHSCSLESCTEPVTTESLGHMCGGLLEGSEDLWVAVTAGWALWADQRCVSPPLHLPRAEQLIGEDGWSTCGEGSTYGKMMVCHQDVKGKGQRYMLVPRIKCCAWNNSSSTWNYCSVHNHLPGELESSVLTLQHDRPLCCRSMPQSRTEERSEDGGGDKTSRGRRKRKGSFMVLSHGVAQARSESRVGRVRAGARVMKEKSHCFGRRRPAGSLPASSGSWAGKT